MLTTQANAVDKGDIPFSELFKTFDPKSKLCHAETLLDGLLRDTPAFYPNMDPEARKMIRWIRDIVREVRHTMSEP